MLVVVLEQMYMVPINKRGNGERERAKNVQLGQKRTS
jgi:hypothetical protein